MSFHEAGWDFVRQPTALKISGGLTKARTIRDFGGKRSNNNTAGETPTIRAGKMPATRPGLSKTLVGGRRGIKLNRRLFNRDTNGERLFLTADER